MILGAREDSGWADIVELEDKNWQFTVGYFDRFNHAVIYERRSNIKTENNCVSAMDAAYERMKKAVKGIK